MIDRAVLNKYGASEKKYFRDEVVFNKNGTPKFYFQVVSGKVKMSTYNDAGKEFIQGIFVEGNSFGEPPLFGDFDYPANAVALEECIVLVLRKEKFESLLMENPEIHLKFTKVLADRLYYKATMASGNSNENAEERIRTILDYLKITVHHIPDNEDFQIDLTRQQIADLTGLRVETVIRTMKKMSSKGMIKIANRKVYR
ncbi:MAG: Crp/Fnr family transcriptional regulator [Crocinitomicaceae bacterium]